MNLIAQRDAAVKAARTIVEEAKAAGRQLTQAEFGAVNQSLDTVKELDGKIKTAKESEDLLDRLGALGPGDVQWNPAKATTGLRLGFNGQSASRFADHLVTKMVEPHSKAVLPSGSTLVPFEFGTQIIEEGRRPLSLLDVLPVKPRTAPSFSYLAQTGRTGGAAPVATGGTKPNLNLGLAQVIGSLSVIACIVPDIDRFWLMDLETVRQWIVDEIAFSVRNTIEGQVINGDGTAPNLRGFLNTSGIQVQAYDTSPLVTLRRAVSAVENLGYTAGVYVLNPNDWANVELTRASGSGTSDFPDAPVNRAEQKVWSVPVTTSTSIAAGTGLLIGDKAAELDVGAEGLMVDWSESSGTDFEKNLIKFRGEQRAHLSVTRPASVVKIDLVEPVIP